jgi:DNA repair photolyase
MSNSSDPYPPEEVRVKLTRRALQILLPRGFKVQIITKGVLVLRDLELLTKGRASVSISVTTLDESLARKIEPGAPSSKERITAMDRLIKSGIPVSARVDPIIPGLNEDVEELLGKLRDAGVRHVVFSTYKARPDNLARMVKAFPELERLWTRLYRKEGKWVRGYWHLPMNLKKSILSRAINHARRLGMNYATCREGLGHEFLNSPTCDGTHLIPEREIDKTKLNYGL